MTRFSPHLHLALLSLFLTTLHGCSRCGCGDASDHLAELVETQGQIQRDWAQTQNKWQSASIGAVFDVGDGIRAKARSEAVLELSEGSFARLKAESMIRFLRTMPGSQSKGIDLQEGEAEIEVGSKSLQLKSAVGEAILEAGSRVRIHRSNKGMEFFVAIGTAKFQTKDKATTVVGAGEGIRIGIGSAVLGRYKLTEKETAKSEAKSDLEQERVEPQAGETVTVHVQGKGVRIRRSNGASWEPLAPGVAELDADTVLNLPEKTSVKLQRKQDKATVYGAGTYRIGQPEQALVHALSGKVTFASSDRNVAVVVPGGIIVADSGEPGGTQASVDVGSDNTLVQVQSGKVEVRQPDKKQRLSAGQEATIANPKTRRASGSRPVLVDNGPDFADFSVKAGDSFVVHSAKPPVAIEFDFADQCPHGGIAQLSHKSMRSQGNKNARLLVNSGYSRYIVRCLKADGTAQTKAKKTGRITVLRDPGTAALPRKAPVSQVDADGRNYKILYQNQLPIVKLRWPNAPKAGSYIVTVSSKAGGKREFKTKRAVYSLKSGALRDGMHRFSYKTADSRQTSKTTTVTIRFDNAAPKITLREPKEGKFHAGESVNVSGVAVRGWKISLVNGTISTDEYNRFRGSVKYTSRYRSIALRVTHQQRGTHYYLRRGQNAAL